MYDTYTTKNSDQAHDIQNKYAFHSRFDVHIYIFLNGNLTQIVTSNFDYHHNHNEWKMVTSDGKVFLSPYIFFMFSKNKFKYTHQSHWWAGFDALKPYELALYFQSWMKRSNIFGFRMLKKYFSSNFWTGISCIQRNPKREKNKRSWSWFEVFITLRHLA